MANGCCDRAVASRPLTRGAAHSGPGLEPYDSIMSFSCSSSASSGRNWLSRPRELVSSELV